ncbi:MAG TPA: LytTR family DNA-binding domain-containing protein [Ferruginibacter sp.]|nr:LytTR family DNA-binding domain-containing protein [Ferruginibacter sp.]HRE62554.1 LytTR family DNA-binding domain-containing protein [Ferruginibacter sp.]
MIKILIVDDEVSASNILKLLIDKNIAGEKEIRCANDPVLALTVIQQWQPNLLMLDIEMPAMNGFDLLSKISSIHFPVIFTTAYDKYAIKAIRYSAFDYLLKPIDAEELTVTFERLLLNRTDMLHHSPALVNNLINNLKSQKLNLFKLALSTNAGVHLMSPADILYCEGVGNYTRFHLTNANPVLVSKTIKEYEELLSEHSFLRVHKSYLVNLTHVIKYDKEGFLKLSNNAVVAISRRKKDELKEKLYLNKPPSLGS